MLVEQFSRDLTGHPDFPLGHVVVSPSACEVRGADSSVRLEPRVMAALLVLAGAQGRTVSRDRLVELCWDGRAVSDDAINRTIAKLRQAARQFDRPPFVVETLPKIGFRLLTSAQEAVTAPTATTEAPPAAQPHRRAWLLGLLGAIAAVVFLALWARAPRAPAAPEPSGLIEIARFAAAPELTALAERLESETRLALPGYALQAAHQEAEGEHLLTGALDRDGDRLIATFELRTRADGLLLWSGRLEHPAAEADGFSQRLMGYITSVYLCAHDQRRSAPRVVTSQETALLLSTCEAVLFGGRDWLEAAQKLQRAAPDLPVAYAFLSAVILNDAFSRGLVGPDLDAVLAASEREARRSIRMEKRNPISRVSLSRIAWVRGDFAEAERQLERGAEVPDFLPVEVTHVLLLWNVGRVSAARERIERFLRMTDPRFRTAPEAMLPVLLTAVETAGLRKLEARLDASGPSAGEVVRAHRLLWWAAPGEALRALPGLSDAAVSPPLRACLTEVLPVLAANRKVPNLPGACDPVSGWTRVQLLVRVGDLDGAYAAVEALSLYAKLRPGFLFGPEMKPLRADPRFMPLAKRLGLLRYWASSGRWPDFCAEPDLPYDCRAAKI